mgnify:CR=1 FL=1
MKLVSSGLPFNEPILARMKFYSDSGKKVDQFIKFLNKRTKNELLSLAVVRNFDSGKTLFVNKFNKKKWVKQCKKFY